MTRDGFQTFSKIVHRAALVGRAIDQRAQTPLAGVTVMITSGPDAWNARLTTLLQGQPGATLNSQLTDGDGVFRWIDLPPGAYTLSAAISGTRYAAATASVTLTATTVATTQLALPPTAVTGVIQAGSPAAPLGQARVRFADSDDATYSASDGSFTLSPVEAGTSRPLEITAQNYVLANQPVTLSQGQTTTAPTITLTHS